MAKPKNPERIAREDLVTRSISRFVFSFRYVPKGGDSIETGTCAFYGNEQSATRKATAYAREKGTLIDSVSLTEQTEKLYGMDIEKFISEASVLDENPGQAPTEKQ